MAVVVERLLVVSRARTTRRVLLDRLASRTVVLGGLVIIASILAILFVIVAEIHPLVRSARAESIPVPNAGAPPASAEAAGVDEYREIAYTVTGAGALQFVALKVPGSYPPVPVPGLDGARVTAATDLGKHRHVLGTSDGRVIPLEVTYEVDFKDGRRVLTPGQAFGPPSAVDPDRRRPIVRLAASAPDGGGVLVAQVGPAELVVQAVVEKKALIGGTRREESLQTLRAPVDGAITALALGTRGEDLFIGTSAGHVARYDLRDRANPTPAESVAVEAGPAPVAVLRFLNGDRTLVVRLATLRKAQTATVVVMADGGKEKELPVGQVVDVITPNTMGIVAKSRHYLAKLGEFVVADPRESNTEGGVFPAIFGTVMMVMIMSVLVTPLGVLAAFYLREYARQGTFVSTVRIAVNNLAGVPSIVFGVFGVGFFIYIVGGGIDRLFFPEALPTPTYGTGGILWASLTLALLTIPVVIVATEEGLAAIPRGMREASLALGATKLETTLRVVLPAVMPSILTGLILAMARAAGEVAPLMITGVVKLAPALPIDGVWPFLHLERKFMHLGFHIYDVGFQSPNVDAARPMVFATTLLLLLIVVCLNLFAIGLRQRLRRTYATSAV